MESNAGSPEKKIHKPPIFTKLGRNSLDLRKMSTTRQIYRTPFPSQRKKPPPHYKFHYDQEVKGWRESEKVTATTRWKQAKGAVRVGNYFIGLRKKPDTVLNIDVKKLVNATKLNRTHQMSARSVGESGDETETIQRALTEPSMIYKPFTKQSDSVTEGVWNCPAPINQTSERSKPFTWDKPKAERKQLVESASKYQALYLQKLLKEKDRDMRLITNQLIKSNKENVSLLRELEGYRGKNYDELYKENITLKEQIARACRENAMLAGHMRKENNRTLQKFEKSRTLT